MGGGGTEAPIGGGEPEAGRGRNPGAGLGGGTREPGWGAEPGSRAGGLYTKIKVACNDG